MPTLVMIDGRVTGVADAVVSVFDRGFLYGDSVFETIRTYGGQPFALEEHLTRLEWSAERVYMRMPVERRVLRSEIEVLLREANNSESFIRVMVTRGKGPLGLDPDLADHPTRVVIVAPLIPPTPAAYTDGVGVVTYRTQRTADATDAAGAKIGNYLVSVLAMREAKQSGAVEALVIDANDCVVEGTSSNLFVVIAAKLVTPPDSAGILPGITRARIIELAAALGIEVEYRAVLLRELRAADELFISSTIREILPVVRVDGALIGNAKPGPVTLRLIGAFRDRFARRTSATDRPD